MSGYPYNRARSSSNSKRNENEPLTPNLETENKGEQALDIWAVIKERKRLGLWDGDIETHEIVEYNLSSGKHYYEIEDLRKRTIVCTSCAIKHGGILEAKLLTHYRLEDGVLYLRDVPVNQKP